MKIIKSYGKYILFFVPAILGIYGFLKIDGVNISWAFYYTLRLFSINTDIEKINIWVEIARWTAPIASAGIILTIFKTVKNSLVNSIHAVRKDSYAVYGDGETCTALIHNLGKNAIHDEKNKIYKANNHIIMFENEDDNLQFYRKHEDEFSHGNIYLSLDNINVKKFDKKNIVPISLLSSCAMMYWQQYYVYSNEKIALIGNDIMIEKLLTRGLQLNLVSTNQHIEYHVFEEKDTYRFVHTELDKIGMDKIVFYNESWLEKFSLLEQMDRVILCGEENENLNNLSKMTEYMIYPKIYVYIKSSGIIDKFYKDEKIIPFGVVDTIATKDIVVNESLYNDAKTLHEHYSQNNNKVTVWDELSEFYKNSNLSSASYGYVLRRLNKNGVSVDEMSELEHIRWCRFHYLNNWKYCKTRNNAKKLHNSLIPYSELSEENKQKDKNNVLSAIEKESNNLLPNNN